MTAPGPWDWAQGYLAPTVGTGPGPSYARPTIAGLLNGPLNRPTPIGSDPAMWRSVGGPAIWLANTMNPVSDINDAVTGSERFSQGLLGGSWKEAASGLIDFAGGLLGMAVPGHYSQYKQATEAASDAARRVAVDTPTISPSAFRDTRGGGERFHGTSSPIDNLGDYYGSDASIYGTGFYTTDAADVGVGYMGKGRGGQPSLYRVDAADDVPLYNLDAPMTPEVREMVRGALGRDFEWAGPTLDDAATLRSFLDAARRESGTYDISRPQTQDFFDSIRSNLEGAGYRGYRHRGGSNTGTAAHDVRLYWTPARDIRLELTSPDLYRLPQDDLLGDALRHMDSFFKGGS